MSRKGRMMPRHQSLASGQRWRHPGASSLRTVGEDLTTLRSPLQELPEKWNNIIKRWLLPWGSRWPPCRQMKRPSSARGARPSRQSSSSSGSDSAEKPPSGMHPSCHHCFRAFKHGSILSHGDLSVEFACYFNKWRLVTSLPSHLGPLVRTWCSCSQSITKTAKK